MALLITWPHAAQATGLSEMPSYQIPFPHLVPASEYGKVVAAGREGAEDLPRVILIEDMHGHLEVQKNMAQLLYTLIPKIQSPTDERISVFIEEGRTAMDTTPIRAIPEPALREITANYLLSKAEISGADYFSVLHPELAERCVLQGAEDPSIYRTHGQHSNNAAALRKELIDKINQTQVLLDPIRKVYYSAPLSHLHQLRARYVANTISSSRYAATIVTWARQKGIDMKAYPFIAQSRRRTDREDLPRLDLELTALHFKLARIVAKDESWVPLALKADTRVLSARVNLIAVDQYLDLLKRMVSEALTPEEARVVYRLLPQLTEVVRQVSASQEIPQLSEILTAQLDFYPPAVMRTHPLLEKSLKHSAEGHPVILIASAFHTQGLIDSFKAQHLSYMVISPLSDRPLSQEEQTNYAKRLENNYGGVRQEDRTKIALATPVKETELP